MKRAIVVLLLCLGGTILFAQDRELTKPREMQRNYNITWTFFK